MKWNHGLAFFWGGAFWSNALPHLMSGVCGNPFQSPFASPPGEGLSPAVVNAVWGLFNLLVGYLLILRVGQFDARNNKHVLVFGVGFAAMVVMLSWHFGQFHGAGKPAGA